MYLVDIKANRYISVSVYLDISMQHTPCKTIFIKFDGQGVGIAVGFFANNMPLV